MSGLRLPRGRLIARQAFPNLAILSPCCHRHTKSLPSTTLSSGAFACPHGCKLNIEAVLSA